MKSNKNTSFRDCQQRKELCSDTIIINLYYPLGTAALARSVNEGTNYMQIHNLRQLEMETNSSMVTLPGLNCGYSV